MIGRLPAELDRRELADNTIVVLWSDHGWKLGEHRGWCKQTNHEIDNRVPLILRLPGAEGNGKSSTALVELLALYPTLCDLASLPNPASLEGKTLGPLLVNPAVPHKEAAFSQFPHKVKGRDFMGYSMRTDRYRYIEWLDRNSGSLAERELYDHFEDPEENQSLAADPDRSALIKKPHQMLWQSWPKPD